DAVHLGAAHRTRALGHAAPGVAGDDLALEVALLLALHAVAVVGLGHVALLAFPLKSLSAHTAGTVRHTVLAPLPYLVPAWRVRPSRPPPAVSGRRTPPATRKAVKILTA